MMKIVRYDDVEDWQMSELTLSCFGHPHSVERTEKEIRTDERLPEWGGKLFLKNEDEEVLGTASLLYPRARTVNGIEKVGGIKSVCSRPSKARKGVARKLLNELHDKMRKKSVNYSTLYTWKGFVAHNLYQDLGYRDLHKIPMAYKKVEDKSSPVRLESGKDSEFVKKLYEKSVDNLYGLTVREDSFWEVADVLGHPNNDHLHIAYEGGEKIGYALFKQRRNHMLCNEICAMEERDVSKILAAMEERSSTDYIVNKWVNPNYREIFEEYGYRYYDDNWGRVMVKNLDGSVEEALEAFNFGENVHVGYYEHY